MRFQTVATSCVLVQTLYMFADFELTWFSGVTVKDIYYYNKRDFYIVMLFIVPAMVSHLVTIWGHYYKADGLFQESIARCSTTAAEKRRRIPVWERHDPWWGFTVKYWILVWISVLLNVVWFAQPMVAYLPRGLNRLDTFGAVTSNLAYASGYAAIGSCGMLLLLVLRRSMLQALGYTYSDILPLHRWMGVAFIFWSTIHTIGYILYYIHYDAFWSHFNFDGNTRGPQNMIALFTYAALLGLGVTAIPQVRRSCYLLFITTHRVFTVILFVGTIMHFPYYMLWYYVLPSVCLYLADRFVPKFIQSCSIARKVECSFNKEADILTVIIHSRNPLEPLKPYYPGDYVNLEIPEVSTICHPFTIASYWAEDPYSMTLYVRTFQETKTSWTGALANLCQEKGDGEVTMLEANVDGVFGDRDHGYLSSKVMVIFAAGAAITTFMSLLKAMAAQIEFARENIDNPTTIEVHLICTFRYESELYAYGDFMHRITHDPRFTSWLHTQIYVSRPDKHTPPPECPSGQCISEFICGRVEDKNQQMNKADKADESTPLLVGYSKESWRGTLAGSCDGCSEEGKGRCVGSSSGTCVSSCASSITITTSPREGCNQVSSTPTKAVLSVRSPSSPSLYRYKSLPTFRQVSSSTVATVHAKKDLVATFIILVVPMIVFLLTRAIPWEGTYKGEDHWCRTTHERDQHMTNRCLWSYAVLPGILHVLTASVLGYLGLWFARNTNLLQKHSPALYSRSSTGYGSISAASRSATSAYRNLLQGLGGVVEPSRPIDNIRSSEIPITKGSIQFKRGRIQVNYHIQELKTLGIGCDVDIQYDDEESMKAKGKGVLVFGGGPDAFVDMIEESCKKAQWDVDFHRETWAP